MVRYNNIILSPKNIDFVKVRLDTIVEIVYVGGKECTINTKSKKEATQLVDDIYKDMEWNWLHELQTR